MRYKPTIREDIERLRRSILVHSYIYYKLNTSIISDYQFDGLCLKLVELQSKYPEYLVDDSFEAREFRDFTGATGYHLPFNKEWVEVVANRLLKIQENRNEQ